MRSSPSILLALALSATAATAAQAAWRFFNNERVGLQALVEPLRQAGRAGCEESLSDFVLLAHDWSKLDYGSHESKEDTRQLTHQHDIGYELTTSLLVDAQTGSPKRRWCCIVLTRRESMASNATSPGIRCRCGWSSRA